MRSSSASIAGEWLAAGAAAGVFGGVDRLGGTVFLLAAERGIGGASGLIDVGESGAGDDRPPSSGIDNVFQMSGCMEATARSVPRPFRRAPPGRCAATA